MERINKRFVYFICLVSAMGGLLFGYDWVVIGGAKPFYELYYQIADSPSDQGLAMTIALIGCLIGAMLCGSLADRIGRKKLLIVAALIFFFSAIATGIANVIFTFVVIFTVDKWGRKALMKLGAGGLCGIYLILGICYFFQITGWFMIVLVVAAIACYAMTLGPVTWVLLAEIFPNRVRAVAVATSTFALWVGSSTLTYTFPLLNVALGSYGTFWIYSAVCLGSFLFVSLLLPETKGKSLEELENELIQH